MLGLAALSVAGCKKENLEETLSYRISVPEASGYTVSAPEYAVAGETVEVTVTVSDDALNISSVLYNGTACEQELFNEDENVYVYSFVMPEKDVTITVNTSSLRHSIRFTDGDGYVFFVGDDPESGEQQTEAIAGETVNFVIVREQDCKVAIQFVTYGEGKVCNMDKDKTTVDKETGATTYHYSFVMPENDVLLTAVTSEGKIRIYRKSGDHVNVHMLNSIKKEDTNGDGVEDGDPIRDTDKNNPTPGDNIYESVPGKLVVFRLEIDFGYETVAEGDNANISNFVTVEGRESGSTYDVRWRTDDYGTTGWSFFMPQEPVLITSKDGVEITIYEGEPFVAEYSGYYIPWGSDYAGNITSVSSPDVEFELKANTVFTLKSLSGNVPGYTYDQIGLYSCTDNVISYDDDACGNEAGRDNDGIGIQGDFNEDAWVMTALDPAQGGLDNTFRYFFSVKKSARVSAFTAAANESGNRFLIEVTKSSGKEYWYYDAPVGQKTLSKVTADFEGKSISEDGADSKITNEAGTDILRYSVVEGKPVFRFVGKEAGTYTDNAETAGELVLDGLGEGTYEGKPGSYVLDESGMNLTFTYTEGGEVSFIIYQNEKTYSIQAESGDSIEGTYSSANSEKAVCGYNPNWFADGESRLTIKTAEDGTLKADFYLAGNGLVFHDEHDVNCVYDASSKKISISGFRVGIIGSWGSSTSIPIEFIVSDDGTTLTCVNEKIQHPTQGPTKYVLSNFWQGDSSWQVVLTKE